MGSPRGSGSFFEKKKEKKLWLKKGGNLGKSEKKRRGD